MRTAITSIVISLLFIFSLRSQESQLSLYQLIDYALEQNFLLKANEKQLDIKKSEIDIIRTQYQPNITLNASASYWKFLLPNKQRLLGNTLSDVYTDITVHQTLYSWGAQDLRKHMVEDDMMLIEEWHRQLASSVIWEVSEAYFETMSSKTEIEIHQNALDQLRSHLLYTQNLYVIGKVSQVDVLRIEVGILYIEKALQKVINAYQAQLIRLHRICYLEEGYWPEIEDATDSLFANHQNTEIVLHTIYEGVRDNHAALRTIDAEINRETKQKELLHLENRPELFSYGIASWNDGYFPFGSNFNYNFGVGLRYTIPYLGGGGYRKKMLQSELRVQQLEDQKNQTFFDFQKEIDLAVNELEDRRAEIESNKKIIELARETMSHAWVKYQGGQGTILDVLDAQSILTESSIDLRKSMTAFLQTLTKLHYLTGNDDKPF